MSSEKFNSVEEVHQCYDRIYLHVTQTGNLKELLDKERVAFSAQSKMPLRWVNMSLDIALKWLHWYKTWIVANAPSWAQQQSWYSEWLCYTQYRPKLERGALIEFDSDDI